MNFQIYEKQGGQRIVAENKMYVYNGGEKRDRNGFPKPRYLNCSNPDCGGTAKIINNRLYQVVGTMVR